VCLRPTLTVTVTMAWRLSRDKYVTTLLVAMALVMISNPHHMFWEPCQCDVTHAGNIFNYSLLFYKKLH